MKSSKVIKQLKDNGWELVRVNGSHHIFKKEGFDLPIVISHPKKDMTIGQIRDAERKSGLKFK